MRPPTPRKSSSRVTSSPGEDGLVADLLEPPPVGEKADKRRKEDRRQKGDDGDSQDQPALGHGANLHLAGPVATLDWTG